MAICFPILMSVLRHLHDEVVAGVQFASCGTRIINGIFAGLWNRRKKKREGINSIVNVKCNYTSLIYLNYSRKSCANIGFVALIMIFIRSYANRIIRENGTNEING